MKNTLSIVVVVFSILTVVSVLLQQKGSGLSGVFGGGNISYLKRRGAEKFLVAFTIVSATILCVVATINIFI
jgi:protein translocase SecG subunit